VSKQPEPAKAELFKVKLAKPHTHQDEPKAVGDTISVTAPERDFLLGLGVIKPETEAATIAAQ
tara:strand:+ start:42099 stop:42287 length:189 start_codon:yes stop_codon:yes gene_type:complete